MAPTALALHLGDKAYLPVRNEEPSKILGRRMFSWLSLSVWIGAVFLKDGLAIFIKSRRS
jgi:hypothetical protein